jgi:CrcB protein
MSAWLAVALGAALGAVARLAVSTALVAHVGDGLPVATLAVNVAGAFLIGVLAETLQPRKDFEPAAWLRPFWLTGFCGAFTTFSLFGLETVRLWQSGAAPVAVGYVAVSLGFWIGAVCLGAGLGRRWAFGPGAARNSRSR